jgi:hypothetical protein
MDFPGIFRVTLMQLVLVLGPFVLAGFLLWLIERSITAGLTRRFGWRAVLCTGWIGTPVHELSHALACVIFRHRVVEMKLWQPDPNTGTLGYIRHEPTDAQSWYQRLGAPFIGIAPLAGGALVLAVLTFTMVPTARSQGLEPIEKAFVKMIAGGGLWETIESLFHLEIAFLKIIFDIENAREWYFWLYLYLVLCVGMHMAPSGPDIKSSWKGLLLAGILLGVVLFIANAIFNAVTGRLSSPEAIAHFVAPAISVLILAILINSAVWAAAKGFLFLLHRRKADAGGE